MYWEAVAIWKQLDLPNMAAEAEAGLARLELLRDNLENAAKLTDAIWAQAETDSDFSGAELPARIYLTCYQVWHKTADARAETALTRGLKIVARQSDGLNDETARHSLRSNISAHRELLALKK